MKIVRIPATEAREAREGGRARELFFPESYDYFKQSHSSIINI
jgi:hypothetical protein